MMKFSSNLLLTIASIVKMCLLSKKSSTPKKSKQQAIILANGPSLNQSIELYQNSFSSYELVCVNFFPITTYYSEFKPENLIFIDPILWNLSEENPLLKQVEENWKAINEKTDWKLNLHLSIKAKGIVNKYIKNSNIKIHYFNVTPSEGFQSFINFSITRGLGMPRPHNVLIPSIARCIQMKFESIYIIGADHSWIGDISVTDNNDVLVGQQHFYKEERDTKQTFNVNKKALQLSEVLQKFSIIFKAYSLLNKTAIANQIKIYNASETSYIDAFVRKKIID